MLRALLSLSVVAAMAATPVGTLAGNNPHGLYRLKQFIYEDGRTSPPGFSQYKYAADSVGLLVMYRPSASTTQWSTLTVEIREPYPLNSTGEQPQGADGHGTQIFNVDAEQFWFKWYNDKWPNMSKLGEFITEVYRKDDFEAEVAEAFSQFEGRQDHTGAGRFGGWWFRVATAANADGTGKRSPAVPLWKAYGTEQSTVVNLLNNGMVLGCNTTRNIRYENDSTIHETGHPCHIHWLSADSHTLTFVQPNGTRLTEVWVRGGLPAEWQTVFRTDIPTYKNGVDCMKEAVRAAVDGRLPAAEVLIAEAISDKDVPMEALCEGTVLIASTLFMAKADYKDCLAFCQRQLKAVSDYADAGHDHTMASKASVQLTEVFKAVSTYRCGDTEKGKKLMEERLSVIDSEIERYRPVRGMEQYVNLLYYGTLMTYCLGYEALGAERTLLQLDALTLMAPAVAAQNKATILKCRANCYRLSGDDAMADKLTKQAEEIQ